MTIMVFFIAAFCVGILLRLLEERGLQCIGLASHRIHFPGPSALPFFGNLLELRNGHAIILAAWARKFPSIMRIVIGDREAVILNTHDAVHRTLVSQGRAFQGRPETREYHGFYASVAGQHNAPTTIGTSPWTDHISILRKHLGGQVTGNKHRRYDHFIAYRLQRFVTSLALHASEGPRDLGYTAWTTTMGISLDMCFGTRVSEADVRALAYAELQIFRGPRSIGQPLYAAVPLLGIARTVLQPMHDLLRVLGLASLLDQIVHDENTAKMLRGIEIGCAARLIDGLHTRLRAGDTTPSQLGDIIRLVGDSYPSADQYKVALSLISTGTGVGTLILWLAGLLAARPDLQATAHAEIRTEYGDATPDPLDTGRVEYISALGVEASRYFASLTLGFPRETTEDAEVHGVFIPRGTTVMHNTYSINRDPARYDRPDEFLPERWCAGHYGRVAQKDPRVGIAHINNGVGRRQCLGIPYIDKTLYGMIILLLHFFKLERSDLGSEGRKEIFPEHRSTGREASTRMDPITDQESPCAAQVLPRAAGVRLVSRDSVQLARWLDEGFEAMRQFEHSDVDAGWP